jgi:nitrogen regulatory protein P-II 1
MFTLWGAGWIPRITASELICRDEDTARLVKLICLEARTGHRGDGIIAVVDVERCVKVRTGDENQLALL